MAQSNMDLVAETEKGRHSGIKAARPLNYLHGLAGHWQPEKGRLSPDFSLPHPSPHKRNDWTCGQGSGKGKRSGERTEGLLRSNFLFWAPVDTGMF